MRDAVLIALLALGFATFFTAHVALAVQLAMRTRPRVRGLVAFLVPPLAPLWGFRAGLRRTASLWCGGLAVYALALLVAKLGG